jgi:hypothetical protein
MGTMSGNLTFTRTDYFTYFTDGVSGTTHRASDQVWNVSMDGTAWIIHVAGPNPQNGRYNSFAKRHLLTFRGGKAEAGGESVDDKLSRLHENRMWENIDGYTAQRHKRRAKLSPANQANYEPGALGPKGESSPLTAVLCDDLSPTQLRMAFAAAMVRARMPPTGTPWVAGQQKKNVLVKFSVPCVLQHDYLENQSDKVKEIKVTVYCQSVAGNTITVHVVHLDG